MSYYVPIDANVQHTINAINKGEVLPFSDFSGPFYFYYDTDENDIGNIVYTVFSRSDPAYVPRSFMVRFGAASTIRQILFGSYAARSEIIPARYSTIIVLPSTENDKGTILPL